MSTLSSIKYNLDTLYKSKNEFDWLMTQKEIPVKKLDRMFKLKKEMLYSLSCILSVNAEDVLSNSFYTSVNFVEQGIINLLKQKEETLEQLSKTHNIILSDAKRVISLLYSMDILQNSIHINIQSENKLLELKKVYLLIYDSNQKEIALSYLKKVLVKYKSGFLSLLELIRQHPLKEELSFEDKQIVFNVFSSISLDYQIGNIKDKVYGETKEDKDFVEKTSDYLYYFEKMFLKLVKICNINLSEFYYQIENEMNTMDVNEVYLDTSVDFICKKYDYDISNEIQNLKKIQQLNKDKLNSLIIELIGYNGVTDLSLLLNNIRETNMLPEYLKDSDEYDNIYKIVQNTDFLLNSDVQVYTVLDEISKNMIKDFDAEEYIKGYRYNLNDLIRQVSHFRQYYITLLDDIKDKILKSYESKIKEIISKSGIKDYDIKENNNILNNLKFEINLLKDALKYINKNFREFSNNNLKIYTKAIQKRYHVDNLFETLEKIKLKNSYAIKTKKLIEKEKQYLKSFVDRKIIKDNLVNEIIDNVIVEDEKLKQEILNMC